VNKNRREGRYKKALKAGSKAGISRITALKIPTGPRNKNGGTEKSTLYQIRYSVQNKKGVISVRAVIVARGCIAYSEVARKQSQPWIFPLGLALGGFAIRSKALVHRRKACRPARSIGTKRAASLFVCSVSFSCRRIRIDSIGSSTCSISCKVLALEAGLEGWHSRCWQKQALHSGR